MEQQDVSKTHSYKRIEFWLATIILLVYIIFKVLYSALLLVSTPLLFEQNNTRFNYLTNDLIPNIIQAVAYYFAFIILSKTVKIQLKNSKLLWSSILLILTVYVALSIVVSITNTYSKAYIFASFGSLTAAYNSIFFYAFMNTGAIGLVFIFYHVVSQNFSIFFNKKSNSYLNNPLKSITIAIVIWLAVLLVFMVWQGHAFIAVCWLIGFPFSLIIFYLNIYWLIPSAIMRPKGALYLIQLIPLIFLLSIIATILFTIGIGYLSSDVFYVSMFVFLIVGTLNTFIAWFIYKNVLQKTEQIATLQTALGKSTADLDFLRSQINPHFLFNALNTIYGTALQEHAERTGEAVQILGDMMRFMLHENVQQKILLSREIEYLNNYISLQKLRTQTSPSIRIETQIEESVEGLKIAPMLLIPFVENAFKHGISLREASYINITLYTKDSHLHYDVYNSIHLKQNNDPEKEKSGVGLENVKQRLQLLYPQQHELIIRETVKEYFIHLTINLL